MNTIQRNAVCITFHVQRLGKVCRVSQTLQPFASYIRARISDCHQFITPLLAHKSNSFGKQQTTERPFLNYTSQSDSRVGTNIGNSMPEKPKRKNQRCSTQMAMRIRAPTGRQTASSSASVSLSYMPRSVRINAVASAKAKSATTSAARRSISLRLGQLRHGASFNLAKRLGVRRRQPKQNARRAPYIDGRIYTCQQQSGANIRRGRKGKSAAN